MYKEICAKNDIQKIIIQAVESCDESCIDDKMFLIFEEDGWTYREWTDIDKVDKIIKLEYWLHKNSIEEILNHFGWLLEELGHDARL